jgi:hypothetical protein
MVGSIRRHNRPIGQLLKEEIRMKTNSYLIENAVTITKTNLLMMFNETVIVYSENHTKTCKYIPRAKFRAS